MPTLSAMRLSIAAAGAGFMAVGTLVTAPASAATISFNGEVASYGTSLLEGTPFAGTTAGTPFEGSIKVDDNVIATVLNSFNGFLGTTPSGTAVDPSGIFSLTIGDTTVSDVGLALNSFINVMTSSGLDLGGRDVSIGVGSLNSPSPKFSLLLGSGNTSVEPAKCLEGIVCEGLLFRNGVPSSAGVGGFFPVTISSTKSVPEPAVVLALGVVGALMLKRKAKTSLG